MGGRELGRWARWWWGEGDVEESRGIIRTKERGDARRR